MTMKWVILILGILSNASASILVKFAMMPPRTFPSIKDPMGALANWPFWLGLMLYGVAFLLYAAALARLPINVAQPILTAGAIATVSIASILFFRESFQWTTGIGILFIIAGVCFITVRIP